LDYIFYLVYQKSQSTERMAYQVIFDLAEGRLSQGHLSQSSEAGVATSGTQSRKRPESSSPSKIKARNQNKPAEENEEED
jgi:hypothetical protein